jgi:SAM-dependent methyltransferase
VIRMASLVKKIALNREKAMFEQRGFTIPGQVAAERDKTIAYYDRNWEAYVANTKNVDMADVHDRFVRHLPNGGRVLDVGAGAGRDSQAFLAQGFDVVAVEPSPKLASHLRGIVGLKVVERRAEEIEEAESYDGIWACASLLHLDDERLDIAMSCLRRSLKPGGIIYVSFGTRRREGRDSGGRFFHDMSDDDLVFLVKRHGLKPLESWHSDSKLMDANNVDWNNLIARKPG